MRRSFSKIALAAGFALALVFTFSCSPTEDLLGNCSLNGGTVPIGDQVWMKENLNCDVSGSRCYDDDPANCTKYGRLYNWETAKRVCPSGWHLPNDVEWNALITTVGDKYTAGRKLKAASGWNESTMAKSGNGTDEYGFSALPGGTGGWGGSDGWGDSDHFGDDVGNYGYWWLSDEHSIGNAYYWIMGFDREYIDISWSHKSHLFSVRCIKD